MSQLSNGRALRIILRREILPVSVGLLVFLGFPHAPHSPMACLLSHHPACTATGRDWVMGVFWFFFFWIVLTAGCRLPGEHRNRLGMWVKDR